MKRKKIKIKDLSIGCLLFVLILGALAGCLLYFNLPRISHLYPFSAISWLNNQKNGVTIINKTEKVVISTSQALEEIISEVNQRVVGIKTIRGEKMVLSEGTGFILSSDGLIVTAASMIPSSPRKIFVVKDNDEIPAQLKHYNAQDNLAVLKVEESNLPVVRLKDSSEVRLGEIVFLMGINLRQEPPEKFINQGLVSSISSDGFKTNITKESSLANGSPLFNLQGEVLGLNLVDSFGNLTIIKTEVIRQLLR